MASTQPQPAWRELYPYQGRFVEVAGHRQHVLDEGPADASRRDAADVVVMLHGNPTWSFYYRDLIAELAPDHRCIAPDWIGCGLSDKPAAEDYPYTLASRIDELEAVLTALVPTGKLTLVVHDWGGMIGMGWAHRHPERVARFVILNNTNKSPAPPQRLPSLTCPDLLPLHRRPLRKVDCRRCLSSINLQTRGPACPRRKVRERQPCPGRGVRVREKDD